MEHLTKDAEKIIEESLHKEKLTEVVDYTQKLLEERGIHPTDLQWTILINHLSEMVLRFANHMKLQDVDISLFSEVSEESIEIAKKIAEKIGGMSVEEAYVLSIHFETAKLN